jgi:hypothetical protein
MRTPAVPGSLPRERRPATHPAAAAAAAARLHNVTGPQEERCRADTGLTEPARGEVRVALLDCGLLAVASLVSYALVTHLLSRVYFLSRADDLLGGLWAVLATVFTCRATYEQSMTAAMSRLAATSVSFVLCLVYLIFLPFEAWALAVLIGASAMAVTLLGRPGDVITAAITTAVVMVASAVSPQHAWQQPVLRFADTVVGVAVGVAAAWVGLRVTGPRKTQATSPRSKLRGAVPQVPLFDIEFPQVGLGELDEFLASPG